MKSTTKLKFVNKKRFISVFLVIAMCITQLNAPPLIVSAAQSNAQSTKDGADISLPTVSTSQTAYSSVKITNEKNTKTLIDCLNPTGTEEKFIPGTTYYLRVKLKKPANMKYFYLFAGEAANGKGYYNGINIINPPGAIYEAGPCNSDIFSKVAERIDLPNPSYGTENGELPVMDGLWKYRFKDEVANGQAITIDIGFVVDTDSYNNLETLTDALQIFMSDEDSNYTNLVKASLSVRKKGSVSFSVLDNRTKRNASPNANVVSGIRFNNADSILYDKIEFDFFYPEITTLNDTEFGFGDAFRHENKTFGTLTISEPTSLGCEDGQQKRHVTITKGYKSSSANLSVMFNLYFQSKGLEPDATYKTYIRNAYITYTGNDTPEVLNASQYNIIYTINKPSSDRTIITPINRVIYNATEEVPDNPNYMTQMGNLKIRNPSSAPSPYEKIIEAYYNSTNAAAKILAITVPPGTSSNPVILVKGIKNGAETSVELKIDQLKLWRANTYSAGFHYDRYTIFAKDIGLDYITYMKADIGHLQANTETTSWSSNFQVSGDNCCAAFGQFTSPDDGIEVVHTYKIYNKDSTTWNKEGSYFSTKVTVTSTLENRLAFNNTENDIQKLVDSKWKSIKTQPAITAGDSVRFTSTFAPYHAPKSGREPNTETSDHIAYYDGSGSNSDTTYGNTSVMANPELYLMLPKGISYKDLTLYLNH